MWKSPILEGILNYASQENISFCMPGHKNGRGFTRDDLGKQFVDNMLKLDITEVDGTDNLHNPQEIIKDALDKLTSFYKSKKSYFLVNGSTSGNLIMVFSALNEGDKVIVERNCHRSIFNGIIMRKLKPIYVKSVFNKEYGGAFSVDINHFIKTIEENREAKAIIITYPNYYGFCSNISPIIEKAKSYGMKVLVDSAHGAHFGIINELPKSAIELGADMVVTSAHKTLPSLTQTAYLHINESVSESLVEFYLSAFSSTSPSYLFLCALDYARYYMETYGKEDYKKLISLCRKYKDKINMLDGFHIFDKDELVKANNYITGSNSIRLLSDIDETRYVLNVKEGLSSHLLLKYLKENGIQGEMSDGRNVVLIFSTFNIEEEFDKLYNVLKNCSLGYIKEKDVKTIEYDIAEMKLLPCEVMNYDKLWVDIDEGEGAICGENITPYPPGIPLVMMGEKIDKKSISIIKYYIENNLDILGIKNRKICVIK